LKLFPKAPPGASNSYPGLGQDEEPGQPEEVGNAAFWNRLGQERREHETEEKEGDDEDFSTTLKPALQAARRKGLAGGSMMGYAHSPDAKKFVETGKANLVKLQYTASFDGRKNGTIDNAKILAKAWCHRMTFFLDDGFREFLPEFDAADYKAIAVEYAEPENFERLAEETGLAQTKRRVKQIRSIFNPDESDSDSDPDPGSDEADVEMDD
jgi:hypothetical protein